MRNRILATVFGLALAGSGFVGCGDDNNGNAGGPSGPASLGGADGAAGAGGSLAADGAAGADGGDSVDGAAGTGGGAADAGAADVATNPGGDCVTGAATTHEQIINACTTAEKVDKAVKLPAGLKVGDMLPALQ